MGRIFHALQQEARKIRRSAEHSAHAARIERDAHVYLEWMLPRVDAALDLDALRYVMTAAQPEASAESPSCFDTLRQRQSKLRAASSLGQPRPASASWQACPAWPAITGLVFLAHRRCAPHYAPRPPPPRSAPRRASLASASAQPGPATAAARRAAGGRIKVNLTG